MTARPFRLTVLGFLHRALSRDASGLWLVAATLFAAEHLPAAEMVAPLLHSVRGPSVGTQDGVFFGTSVAASSAYSAVGEPGGRGFVKVFDPTTGNLLHLIANPSGESDYFGHAVALSGSRLAVSAWAGRAGTVVGAGRVYLYNLDGPNPAVPDLILSSPSPESGESFGYSLAFSGSRLVAGAPFASSGGKSESGRIFVFDVNSTTPQTSVIVVGNPTPADRDHFGISVTTAGNRVVAGAPGDDTGMIDAGRAYVYDMSRSLPSTPLITLSLPVLQFGAGYGSAVSLSGSTLAVAAPNESINGTTGAGRVYLHDLNAARPTTPAVTMQSAVPTTGEFFGEPVVLAGTRLLAGTLVGEARLYDISQPLQPIATLSAPNATPDFQLSLAMVDGTALIGDPVSSIAGAFAGSAFVYSLTLPIAPNPTLTLSSPTPRGDDQFASSVALSGDRLVAGAPSHQGTSPTAPGVGRVYVHDLSSGSQLILENPSPDSGDNFGAATASSGNWVVVSAPGDSDTPGAATGSVYVYNFDQGPPLLPAFTITNPNADREGGYGFGSVLAMTGQIIVAGAKSSGSAYVYDLGSPNPALPVATLTDPNPGKGNFPWSIAIGGNVVAIGDSAFKLNSEVVDQPVDGDEEPPVDGEEEPPIEVPETDSFVGIVHVYHLAGVTGTVAAAFTVLNPATAENTISYFGEALATDGSRLAVAGRTSASDASEEVVYVYNLSANAAASFTTFQNPSPQPGDEFGASLAFMGEQLAVGAPGSGSRLAMDPPFENSLFLGVGEVYIYDLDLDTLGVLGSLTVPEVPLDPRLASGYRFGAAVVADANRFAVGAPAGGVDFSKRSAFVFGLGSKRPAIFAPAEESISRNPITISFAIRELISPGSLTLAFNNQLLSLAASQESPGSHTFTFDPANPIGSPAISSGSPIPEGVYQLTLSYVDRDGNQVASAPVDNVVIDLTPPLIAPLANVGLASTNRTGAVVSFPAAQVSDSVGLASVTYSRPSGSLFPPGATEVSVIATDTAGNIASASFSVSVLNVEITKPAEKTTIPFSTKGVIIEGRAGSGVSAVTVSLNGAAPVAATLTPITGGKRWFLTATNLNHWENTVTVTATAGNAAVTSRPRTFYYQVTGVLPISISPPGTGSVTFSPPLIGGKLAAYGRTYTATAVAKPTSTFDKWTATLAGGSATTSFVFAAGDTIAVEFIPTTFTSALGGTYTSTLLGDSAETNIQDNAGSFTATILNTSGAFSARVNLDGLSSTFTGSFYHASGNFRSPVLATGLSCDLTLDSTGPVNRISGSVTRRSEGEIVATLAVNAPQAFDAKVKPPTTSTGSFNIALKPTPTQPDNESGQPDGVGVATLAINGRTGAFSMKGYLADGTPFTSSGSLGRDGTLPIYLSLKSRSGSLAGTATIDPLQAETDVSGEGLRWFRRVHTGHYYPAGFERSLSLIGAGIKTSSPTAIGLSTSLAVELSGGAVEIAINQELQKSSSTRYTSTDQSIRLDFSSSGQFTGYYKPSALVGSLPIRGMIVGKGGTAEASGYILSPLPKKPDGTGKSGLVELLP